MDEIDFEQYSVEEVWKMVKDGIVTEEQVRVFYSNEWWNESP